MPRQTQQEPGQTQQEPRQARAKGAQARARESESKGGLTPPGRAHERARDQKLGESALRAVGAFLAEWQQRQVADVGNRGPGFHSSGFFGADGSVEVEAQLMELLRSNPKVGLVVARRFWAWWDERDQGAVPRRMAQELQRCAVDHGQPSALSALMAQVGAEG